MAGRDRDLAALIRRALEEDAAADDMTTRRLALEGSGRATVAVRGGGIMSGHEAARGVFDLLDERIVYEAIIGDGSAFSAGDTVAEVRGPITALLAGERVALNFLQHLSGVATMTGRFVELVSGTGITILDTRKTLPGLRALEKDAVLHGGGSNHRRDLSELVLVKENHIVAAGGLERVIERLGDGITEAEIEVSSIEELEKLAAKPPWRIMLDNFTPEMVSLAIEEIEKWGRRPEIEVSGGVTLDTVSLYAIEGVDCISVGSLTSSAPSADMSMRIEEMSS